MVLTDREAYVLGWVFGRIKVESKNSNIGGPVEWAAQRPYTGMGKIIFAARQERILTDELDMQIAEALDEIDRIPDGQEDVQPLAIQSSWDLGYYAGLAKRPLAGEFNIAELRKRKKMTQVQLADAIGVSQDRISRWESGKITPNKESLAKLKAVLFDDVKS